jgi:hypothetical protein
MGAPPEITKLMGFMQANFGSEGKAKLVQAFGKSGITPQLLAAGQLSMEHKNALAKSIMEECFKPTLQSASKLRMVDTQIHAILGIAIY